MLASHDQQVPVSIDMLCTFTVKLIKSKLPELQFNASRALPVLWGFSKNKWAILVLHCMCLDKRGCSNAWNTVINHRRVFE